MKRKFIAFDADNSMASIGGKEEQKEVFGFAPQRITGGLNQLGRYLTKMLTTKNVPINNQLGDLFGDIEETEPKVFLSDKAIEFGIEGIIIDTFTRLAYQTRTLMMKEAKKPIMDLQLWQKYGDEVIKFMNFMASMEFPVIMTAHVDRDKDENGGPIEIPAVKGAAKTAMAEYFDIVAYTTVSKGNSSSSKTVYSWQIQPDGRHIYAKDRKGVVDEAVVDQNLDQFLTPYANLGLFPKILILGSSGQGKTTSLKTINK